MKTKTRKRFIWCAGVLSVLALASCGSDGGGPITPPDDTPKPGHVYNYAGTGVPGYGAMGQVPSKTQLYWPQDIVFSPSQAPVILDWNNHRVVMTDGGGKLRLVVGVAGGDFGDPCPAAPAPCVDINALNAKLNHPTHVAFDASGDMWLSAWHNSALFYVDMGTGLMNRVCGDGSRAYNGDNQPAAQAFVDLPAAIVFDQTGNLVFADQANQLIRRIDEFGIIHNIAGTAKTTGFTGDGGPATAATFWFEVGQTADPSGKIAYDAAGNLYVADTQNHAIRVIDTSGNVNRFAGLYPASPGYSGDGSQALSAQLRQPRDVAVDSDGNVLIADTGNHVIRMVAPNGTITTIAGKARPVDAAPLFGDAVRAEDGKAALLITLTSPFGIEVDAQGRVWIADTENNVVRVLYR